MFSYCVAIRSKRKVVLINTLGICEESTPTERFHPSTKRFHPPPTEPFSPDDGVGWGSLH